MSEVRQGEQDWTQARTKGLRLMAIIEQAPLSMEQRQALANLQGARWPLMYQAELAQLRSDGPLLLDLSEQPFEQLLAIDELFASNLAGWLSTTLPADRLATHLGDALVCQDANDAVLLIRSYSAEVLPLLYQQSAQPWQRWLFGPLGTWWVKGEKHWQRLTGPALGDVPEYHPIRLDEPMMHSLQHDAQAEQLLAQTEHVAPQAFASDCHGERLQQIQDLLGTARAQGLQHPEDQSTFVLHSLITGDPLHQRPYWPELLRQVGDEQDTLENALATQEDT
ncbi:DUF4123 domain-containing protein [Pseudomonas chlororaphis]|uniref:DUF4123 domain-containing protein n=1 Tax=Pseudomonas chlororaphis TaxID=587753 RepID=UPI001E5A36AB|nr:DUF4123 domain-containing protein [Pseudomonas chlororaphis]MCB2253910.1 DUF4123 domain-containing protein [Pseudomonas chlororaphis]